MVCLLTSYGIYSVVRTNKAKVNVENKVEERANVDIYGKEDKNEEKADIKEEDKTDTTSNSNAAVIKITALGEIMLGKNNIPQSSYALAFKEVASYTEKSDYTVASLDRAFSSARLRDGGSLARRGHGVPEPQAVRRGALRGEQLSRTSPPNCTAHTTPITLKTKNQYKGRCSYGTLF